MSREIPNDIAAEAANLAHDFLNGRVEKALWEGAIGFAIAAERSAAIAFAEQLADSCDAHAASYGKKDRLKAQASSAQAHILRQFASLFGTRHG